MDKLLVEIYIPAIGSSYDVFLPTRVTIEQAIKVLDGVFAQLNQEYYVHASQMLLCDKETGIIFNPKELVCNTRIVNGSKLLFI